MSGLCLAYTLKEGVSIASDAAAVTVDLDAAAGSLTIRTELVAYSGEVGAEPN
jgi:hypothetical protein